MQGKGSCSQEGQGNATLNVDSATGTVSDLKPGSIYTCFVVAQHSSRDICSKGKLVDLSYQYVSSVQAETETSNNMFGFSSASNADGTIAAVGSPFAQTVEVYSQKKFGKWIKLQTLSPDVDPGNVEFGVVIGITGKGDRILVGAPGAQKGSDAGVGCVYVFERNSDGEYVIVDGIYSPVTSVSGNFGSSLSLTRDGNILAVGAATESVNTTNAGAVYIFEYIDGSYIFKQQLKASNEEEEGQFGSSVAIASDSLDIVVGAPTVGVNNSGAVYYFQQNGLGAWVEEQLILCTNSTLNNVEQCASSVAISADGNTIVAGAPLSEPFGTIDAGLVGVLQKSGGATFSSPFVQLISPNPSNLGRYGSSVALDNSGKVLLVGAPGETPDGKRPFRTGAVYVYAFLDGTWTLSEEIYSPKPVAYVSFGTSISLDFSGAQAIITSILTATKEITDSGVAYFYALKSNKLSLWKN